MKKNRTDRFKLMIVFTEKELKEIEKERSVKRNNLQKEREKEGICEGCGSRDNVSWRESYTRYCWHKDESLEDPNRKLFFCNECAEIDKEYWAEMWKECYRGGL